MSPIDAIVYPLPPAARVLALYLAHERRPHKLPDITAACALAPWEVEEAVRVLSRPEQRWLVNGDDLERIELRDDTPFSPLFASKRAPKEKT